MPLVTVKLTPAGLTEEKRERIIARMTEVIAEELGKKPASTWVIIEEVATDHWGVGGESLAAKHRRED